jgi:hypothetical protein
MGLGALGLVIHLTYLWDTVDQGRLILVVGFGILFGFALAQVPPMKSLMGGGARSAGPRTGPEATNNEAAG